MVLLTRARRPLVSPSLTLNEPASRTGGESPSLDYADAPPAGYFRPVSPSLLIEELMPSPVASPRGSPSLGLIAPGAMRDVRDVELTFNRPKPLQTATLGVSAVQMTTASCKRASRMARPAEPSEVAREEALQVVADTELELRMSNKERVADDSTVGFKLKQASTGKGPAVRADSLDIAEQATAQAKMNHMVAIKSRSVDTGNQEPTWLVDYAVACPQMYGRLAASAIKRFVHPIALPSTHTLPPHFPISPFCRLFLQ